MSPNEPLLEVTDLDIRYRTIDGDIRAVTDASFTIHQNEYVGLVGESGSGKSTIAKALIGGLDENGEISSGTVRYKGTEIQDYSEDLFDSEIRWDEVAMIPQSAMNSLDPLMRISEQAIELAHVHTDWDKTETMDRLRDLFEVVGLSESRIHDYPHQFSGGMKQRTVIALALLLDPSLIIADEPTTALDVIMQDQIIRHINKIKREQNISLLLITHDISVVLENCDSVVVMHGGQVAESGSIYDIFDRPRHPYTIMLQQAFPDIRFPDQELQVIEGQTPTLREDVDFCTFADRCPWAKAECRQDAPPLTGVDESNSHRTSCIRSDEITDLATEYISSEDHDQSDIFGYKTEEIDSK